LISVIGEEYRTSEAAYYWMLSILSGKALDDLEARATDSRAPGSKPSRARTTGSSRRQ
jgi:hypothetical protein